jgi:hypothetical protein
MDKLVVAEVETTNDEVPADATATKAPPIKRMGTINKVGATSSRKG